MNKIRYYIVLLLVGCAQWVAAQGYISGTVSEMIGGVKEGCVGANVAIVNSQNRVLTGATTDLMGNYTLNLPDEKDELTVVFSYIDQEENVVDFLALYTLTGENREEREKVSGRFTLFENSGTIYSARIFETQFTEKYSVTPELIKNNFSIIYSEWNPGNT